MADETKGNHGSKEEENLKMERLLETEKLIFNHDQLKKELKKRLRKIAEKSRGLVFEQVEKDKQNQFYKTIGKGVSAVGSGISFLGATLIPFVPPAGYGISAFGAGVAVVGYLILGVNTYYRIKAKKGREKLAKIEFENFKDEMKLIINEYDESSTEILDNISTYPEVSECQNFAEQLDSLRMMVEKYNVRKGGKYPLPKTLKLVTILMDKDCELNKDENNKIILEKLVEATREDMETAVDGMDTRLETLKEEISKDISDTLKTIESKDAKLSDKIRMKLETVKDEAQKRMLNDAYVGAAFATAKPIVEGYALHAQLGQCTFNAGMGAKSIIENSVNAATCTAIVLEGPVKIAVSTGSVIFVTYTSFLSMCINGYATHKAYKKYKGLRDLLDKAEEAGDFKDQLRVLMENERYRELAGKAITTIEVVEAMIDILEDAI